MQKNFLRNNFILIQLALLIGLLTFVTLASVSVNAETGDNVEVNNVTMNDPPYGPIETGNGTPILAREGIQLHLRTQTNFQINATFGEDVKVSVNETVDCPLGDCPQVQNHNRLTYMWQIEINNSEASLSATFGFPYDPENLPEGCSPEGLKYAFFNGSLNQWQFIHTWVNNSQNMVYASTDHFSLWTIFAEPDQQGPQEPNKNEVNNIQANGTPIKMESNNIYRFQIQNGFQLNVSFDKDVEMNITEKTKTQLKTQEQVMAKEMIGTGKYLEIETNDTGAKIQATLMFEFSKSELNESIDPLTLQFAYFNGELNQWEKVPSWVEEIEPGKFMVYANTTHFSTWTVVGEEIVEESSSVIGFELLTLLPIIAILVYRKRYT